MLSTDIEMLDAVELERLPQLMDLFATEWWTADRTAGDVIQMLRGSDLVFALVYRPADRLAAFARVLTDGTYMAMILDVIVATEFRGRGLGTVLLKAILRDSRLAAVRSVELVCQPDVVAFYARLGFTDRVGHSTLMRRTTDQLLTGG